MTKLRVDISVSADGYAAGPEPSLVGLLDSGWFVPVILVGTALGILYYGRE